MNAIAFTTANYVARETGWAMHGWGHGDRTTNEAFAPVETFADRFDELLRDVVALGFDTIDLWGAHLNPTWATDEHVGAARELLDRHGLDVASYATWAGPAEIERACEIAVAVGTDLIAARVRGRGGRARACPAPARRPARAREPSRAHAAGGAGEDRGGWRRLRPHDRHGLVGYAGLRPGACDR